MKIAIGSDHRGYAHKSLISTALVKQGNTVVDHGCPGPESSDYPDPAIAVGEAVASAAADVGVLICGSGIGVCIAANKVRGIRAALVFTPDQARMTRLHNDSNVLCLSGDGTSPAAALDLVAARLATEFAGGRHAARIAKITAYEDQHLNQE